MGIPITAHYLGTPEPCSLNTALFYLVLVGIACKLFSISMLLGILGGKEISNGYSEMASLPCKLALISSETDEVSFVFYRR